MADVDDLAAPSGISPEHSLVEIFDFVEVCCGADGRLSNAMAQAGFRVGPLLDIRRHAAYDLLCPRLVGWLLWLVSSHRIWLIHSHIPSRMFLPRSPQSARSAEFPWGLPLLEHDTKKAKFMLSLTLALLFIASRTDGGVAMSHHHPRTAFSWKVRQWDTFRSLGRSIFFIGAFDFCRYGHPHRSSGRLALLHFDDGAQLLQKCRCAASHTRSQQALAAANEEYPSDFCAA